MPNYNYTCDVCGHEYVEGRAADHPQWKTKCPVFNCTGNLVEVK